MNQANKTANSDIAEIISKLKYISTDDNQDLTVQFKGYTHGKTGFVIQLNFVEIVSDQTVKTWKNISDQYQCEVDMDYNNRTVNLYFEPKIQKVKNYSSILYLSLICLCIWILYNRHSNYLMPNYMNQT
tara:strand:- start:1253 stop:1639 length:387 start_codon:yes stop_codon:yes gene_type:complete